MNLLSLNVNGFGKGDFKYSWVAKLINTHKVIFAGIQETKRKGFTDFKIYQIWGSVDFDYVFQSSIGKRGGLLSVWNKNLFSKSMVLQIKDCLIVQGIWLETNKPMCFINVYAGQSLTVREDLWNYISCVLQNWNGISMVFGDFNEVRNQEERRGSQFDGRAAKNSINSSIETV